MKYTCFQYIIILAMIIWGFSINIAEAKRLTDVTFQPEYRIDGTRMTLQGTGLIKHFIFTVNATALYLEENIGTDDPLQDVPKRLEFEYFHKIKSKDFVKLTNKWIAENNDTETIARLQAQIDQFNALYTDVRPGDRHAITYQPGKGTKLALNGEVLGTIKGADFAKVLFSIWLGPKPVSKSLKVALLK